MKQTRNYTSDLHRAWAVGSLGERAACWRRRDPDGLCDPAAIRVATEKPVSSCRDRGLEQRGSVRTVRRTVESLVARDFIGWLDAPPGAIWVDVGCGTGALSNEIGQTASPERVDGIDPSGAFIEQAAASLDGPMFSFR